MSINKWMEKEDAKYIHTHIHTHTHTHTHTYAHTHTYIYTHIYTHTHIYICNGILLSHKKRKIMAFAATWMNLEIII